MPVLQASPVAKNALQKALETQDKLCSMKYAENEGSYKKMFESLSGLTVPAYLKEHDKKPFTGFKLLRTYNVKLLNLALSNSIDFIFCRDGKVQWIINQPLQEDVDWSAPLCVYTPDVAWEVSRRQSGGGGDSGTKNTKNSRDNARDDLSNFHCFKLARRKKYTNRKVSLFFPGSWIGGMFYCDLTDDMKRATLDTMHGNLAFKRGHSRNICTQQNSIPLVPMQSDDYSKNWIEFKILKRQKFSIKTFSPQITKFVPYINTPNDALSRLNFDNNTSMSSASTVSNWRKPFREQALSVFQRNKGYSYEKKPWYAEIEVQENYKITPEDMSLWGGIMDRTMARLNSITGKPNVSFSFLSCSPMSAENSIASKGLFKRILKRIESKIWNRLQFRDKIISIVGENPNSLEKLEIEWKNLRMKNENFEYSYEVLSE